MKSVETLNRLKGKNIKIIKKLQGTEVKRK